MRFLPIPVLAIGVVLGYGFAFHSMHHHRDQREAWERHFTGICENAIRSAKGGNVPGDNAKSGSSKGDNVKTDNAPSTESNEP